jgi:hypothetical protein
MQTQVVLRKDLFANVILNQDHLFRFFSVLVTVFGQCLDAMYSMLHIHFMFIEML